MTVKKRELNLINNLISGLCIITLGIIVTVGSIDMYTKVINLIVYVFIIYGLSKLVNFILNKKIARNISVLLGIIVNIILGFVMLIFPKVPLSILPIVFSIYLLFNSIVKFINYIILKEINLKSRYKELFFSVLFLMLSMLFLFYPLKKLNLFVMIIGIYCILLGFNRIYEFITDILSEKYKLKIKRKLRISLPIFFEAFIPKRALKNINKYIDYLTSEEKIEEINSDLKVFIHLSKYGFNQFGHMDIMFEDKIYSYGNYDKSSQKLFTALGDGVLFVLNKKDKYIEFCINNSKKTIVEYGIKLTDSQKDKMRKELNKIMEDSVAWEPPVLQDRKRKIKNSKKEYKDYASKLYKATKAEFYKFSKGEYKIYFVLGVNCAYFADTLLKNCVFDVLKLVGIISPGTYYEYLEENYRKRYSKVVSKKIFNKESISDVCVEDKK